MAFLNKGVSTVGEKLTIEDLARTLLQIMFAPENVIQIHEVKNKLNYWGLTQPQVNHMFLNCSQTHEPICYSQAFPMKSYLKRFIILGKSGKRAGTGFTKEVLEVAENLSIGDSTYETLAKNAKSNPNGKSAENLRANNIKRENASNVASITRLTARRNALTDKTEIAKVQERINATRKRADKRATDLAVIAISKTTDKDVFEKNLKLILNNEDEAKKEITETRLRRAFDARVNPKTLPPPSAFSEASAKVLEVKEGLEEKVDNVSPELVNLFENLAKAVNQAAQSVSGQNLLTKGLGPNSNIRSKDEDPENPVVVAGSRKTYKRRKNKNKRRTY
jgi:hypothetical protein